MLFTCSPKELLFVTNLEKPIFGSKWVKFLHGLNLTWLIENMTVEMDDTESDVFKVPFGVPQGVTFRPPTVYIVYTQTPHIYSKGVPYYLTATQIDTQIYLSFCPNTPNEDYCINVLETCIEYIRAWMLQNKLMLNDRKTELLVIGTTRQVSKFNSNGISVGDTAIKAIPINVRNLGVLFDTQLNMDSQIISVCK